MILDEYQSDDYGDSLSCCVECQALIDSLRDTERQCREVEDQQIRAAAANAGSDLRQRVLDDLTYEARIRNHERERNRALDALFRHQRLKH